MAMRFWFFGFFGVFLILVFGFWFWRALSFLYLGLWCCGGWDGVFGGFFIFITLVCEYEEGL